MCKRILVVDDEDSIREIISLVLAQPGTEIVEAKNGIEGLEKARSGGKFDLIITDNNMPGMKGVEMIAQMRRFPEMEATPIVLVSADAGLTCEACKVDAIVSKPFKFPALTAAVDMVCSK